MGLIISHGRINDDDDDNTATTTTTQSKLISDQIIPTFICPPPTAQFHIISDQEDKNHHQLPVDDVVAFEVLGSVSELNQNWVRTINIKNPSFVNKLLCEYSLLAKNCEDFCSNSEVLIDEFKSVVNNVDSVMNKDNYECCLDKISNAKLPSSIILKENLTLFSKKINDLSDGFVSSVKWSRYWKFLMICFFISMITALVAYSILDAVLSISKAVIVGFTALPIATIGDIVNRVLKKRLARIKKKLGLMLLLKTAVDSFYFHVTEFRNFESQAKYIKDFDGYSFADMLTTESCIAHLKGLVHDSNAQFDSWKSGLRNCRSAIRSSQTCVLKARKLLGDLE